jgi:hypothetical protein
MRLPNGKFLKHGQDLYSFNLQSSLELSVATSQKRFASRVLTQEVY